MYNAHISVRSRTEGFRKTLTIDYQWDILPYPMCPSLCKSIKIHRHNATWLHDYVKEVWLTIHVHYFCWHCLQTNKTWIGEHGKWALLWFYMHINHANSPVWLRGSIVVCYKPYYTSHTTGVFFCHTAMKKTPVWVNFCFRWWKFG